MIIFTYVCPIQKGEDIVTKPITYTATYNGKVVGTRKSPRPYLYAIVVQNLEEVARLHAYRYEPTKTDRSNFDWRAKCAAATVGEAKFSDIKGSTWEAEEIARAKETIEGGWDAYVSRLRYDAIARFEAAKASGHFEPHVFGWSMSSHNAKGMAATAAHPSRTVLGIVPAEAK